MNLLEVDGLRKSYPKRGGDAVTAVDGVSFAVAPGEIVGLLGPNGAGKTTTIKMICGLVRPDEGRAAVRGHDVQRDRRRALRHISAVLEGNRNLYWRLTVRENLTYFAGNRGRSARSVRGDVDALLERFRLGDKRDEVVNALSRGMQQKLAIAVAVMAGTEVILLDEPTLGLDVETGYEVRELMREVAAAGRTVIVSTHDMPVVQDVCERVVVVDAGKVVVDDQVENLLALFRTRAYRAALGAPLTEDQIDALRQAFPVVNVDDDALGVHVDLPSGDDLYRFIDVLKRERTPIASLDRAQVDFEQVFRRIVRRRGAPGDVPSAPLAPEVLHAAR